MTKPNDNDTEDLKGVSIRVSLYCCGRCGEPHEDLSFERLVRPMRFSGWTHWCPCPSNGQPIVLRIEGSPDDGDGPS